VEKRVEKLLLGETDVSKLEDNNVIYCKPQNIEIWIAFLWLFPASTEINAKEENFLTG
jgi:hypothetical protein